MSRSRNIKPGFFKNEVLADMPCDHRLLFIGLWTLADREGRLEDRPKRIKMELFAYDSFDIEPMLNRLQADGFLIRYAIDGVNYIQITNFVKHQDPHYKEKASVIPAPPGAKNFIVASGVTRTQRARIFERDGYKCVICNVKDSLCIDHILPVSRGGDSSDENLQTLCMSCNTKKGNKIDGEEKNSRQRRAYVEIPSPEQNSPSPSDSLIPDSLLLIPDSPLPEPPALDRLVLQARERGRIAAALKAQGVDRVNPAHPAFCEAVAAGVTLQEFVDTAAEFPGKPLPYLCATIKSRRLEAATPKAYPEKPKPPAPNISGTSPAKRPEELESADEAMRKVLAQYPEAARA